MIINFIRKFLSICVWIFAAFIALAAFGVEGSRLAFLIIAAIFAAVAYSLWPSTPKAVGDAEFQTRALQPQTQKTNEEYGYRSSPKKKETVKWLAPGQSIDIGGYTIASGMIYLGQDGGYHARRSTIDPKAKITRSTPDLAGESMGYWPSYSEISPQARLAYLQWLSNDRPGGAYIGYVFLFFYGLERRVLDESAISDYQIILSEVQRLRTLYADNRSFDQYSSSFLDLLMVKIAEKGNIQSSSLPIIKEPVRNWQFPISTKIALGRHLESGQVWNGEWMFVWHTSHPEAGLKTAALRAFDIYKTLFILRFNQAYPSGITIKKPKARIATQYQSASGESHARVQFDFPDVEQLKKPFNIAVKISEVCQEELSQYSRFIGRNPAVNLSPKALSLLPPELMDSIVSSEKDGFRNWLETLVPKQLGQISGLSLLEKLDLDIGTGKRLPKARLKQAQVTLKAFGYGFEPDPELASHIAGFDEKLVLFKLPQDRQGQFSDAFQFAALLATLSVAVANADNNIDRSELGIIARSISKNPYLTNLERTHLIARAIWLSKNPPSLSKLGKALAEVSDQQRRELAACAISVSLADGQVDAKEMLVLEKIYKHLGLQKQSLFSDIHQAQTSAGSTDEPISVRSEYNVPENRIPEPPSIAQNSQPGTVKLDLSTLERIRAETSTVSTVLANIFENDYEEENEVELPDDNDAKLDGLDKQHAVLLRSAISQKVWEQKEFEDLCRSFGLLPGGALETLNEWSFDNYDDPIIEDEGNLIVNEEVAKFVRDIA